MSALKIAILFVLAAITEIDVANHPRIQPWWFGASGAGSFYSEITFASTSGDARLVEGPPSSFNLADSATGAVVGKRAADSGLPEKEAALTVLADDIL